MGILDKLKPQPRWKHQDPAIRAEAVRDLDDAVELAVLTESDPDVRVRRAALARVADPAVLGRVASGDPDADLRDRASDALLTVATKAASGADADAALTAVRLLTDARRLSTIAKSDAPIAVATEALARTADERALSSIARHAKHEAIAAAALARLSDATEIVEVALHADHREVALAAFDRAVAPAADLDLLRSLEARAQHKSVSRRARTMIQDIESAEAARLAAIEERRRREQMLCESVEQVADLAADIAMARAELARITESWRNLDVTDPVAVERFSAGAAAAEAAIARREREAEEMAERRRLRAEAIATREALCARVETLDGEDVPEQLIPIEEEWRSLLPLVGNGPEADRLAERFAQAVAACRKRHEMGAVLADTRVKLDALVAEAEGLLSDTDTAAAAARWQALSREARGLTALLSEASRPSEDLTTRLTAVADAFAARDAAQEAAAEQVRQDQISQLQRLVDRATRVSAAETMTLREGERLMRDAQKALDAVAQGPVSREIEDAATRLRALQEQVAPRVRELREMDEWRRFANAQRQEQLIAMAEAIVTSLKQDEEASRTSDLAATAKALRELHTQWHEVAEAPRQSAQRLWDRFRTATDFIRSRCEVYFAQLRETREAALQKRAAMVVEAESLTTSTDWGRTTARFQQLQEEWQALGPVGAGREAGRELAQRFRAACNAFFTRRREDLSDRKKTWTENLAKKEALCDRAEALANSTDWDAAAAEIKRLQAEWKTIGPVRKNKSEQIWNRFRASADAFFERYHHRHEITLATKLAEREAFVVDLEALADAAAADVPADFGDRVQQLRQAWNRAVPIPAPGMKPLADRWQAALARAVAVQPEAFRDTDLDPQAVVQRMEKLVARVEELLANVDDAPTQNGISQTELLAERLRSAFASNAMGGRASEESKWRAAANAVKDAQAAWQRLAPAPSLDVQALETRFHDACRKVNERVRRHLPGGGHGSSQGSHGGRHGQHRGGQSRRHTNEPAIA